MIVSVPIQDTMELISGKEVSPLITKGVCKVCYVGQEPNRNGTVITKEVATEMAKKLPGSPVVGFFNKKTEDFEGHNREIVISGGAFEVIDTTKPYGFVPTDATIWFQKFNDDGVEHEYLCSDIYIWTGAYPEAERIFDKGNNQSMELTNDSGSWANDVNSGQRIFIYNEALIEKLCVLGENVEPCFEGAQVKGTFSLESDPAFQQFKTTMYSKIAELEESLSKGGNSQVFDNMYAVEIGDALWCALYDYLDMNNMRGYRINGIYEDNGQKFAILGKVGEQTLYRMNFEITEDGKYNFDANMEEVVVDFKPAQFELAAVEEFENNRYAAPAGEPSASDPEPAADPTPAYNLEEVVEYQELKAQFDELNSKYEALQGQYSALEQANSAIDAEVESLKAYKLAIEKKEKQSMIDSFYMLSEEDKKDVIENIDTYSLNDIEAKLSILCVRNKVSFNADSQPAPQGMFTLNSDVGSDDTITPAWILAVQKNQ